MKKFVTIVCIVFFAVSALLTGCGKEGAAPPEPQREYESVEDYVSDYLAFMEQFRDYMNETLQDDGTIKAGDKELAAKWMENYSAFQMKGFGYRDEEKEILETTMMESGILESFMQAFMPFNAALYSQ